MTKISKNYKPTLKEKFMNSKMKEYFRLKLINWKKSLLKEFSLEGKSKGPQTDSFSEKLKRFWNRN